MGLDPLGGAYAVPMPLTPTGYVAIKSPEEQQADQDAAAQAQSDALQAHAAQNAADSMTMNTAGVMKAMTRRNRKTTSQIRRMSLPRSSRWSRP